MEPSILGVGVLERAKAGTEWAGSGLGGGVDFDSSPDACDSALEAAALVSGLGVDGLAGCDKLRALGAMMTASFAAGVL